MSKCVKRKEEVYMYWKQWALYHYEIEIAALLYYAMCSIIDIIIIVINRLCKHYNSAL